MASNTRPTLSNKSLAPGLGNMIVFSLAAPGLYQAGLVCYILHSSIIPILFFSVYIIALVLEYGNDIYFKDSNKHSLTHLLFTATYSILLGIAAKKFLVNPDMQGICVINSSVSMLLLLTCEFIRAVSLVLEAYWEEAGLLEEEEMELLEEDKVDVQEEGDVYLQEIYFLSFLAAWV